MRTTLRRWLTGASAALLITSALVSASVPTQAATPATYQGTITDADTGAPVAGACVGLFRTPVAPDTESCTDSDGRYTITNAAAGVVYRIRVRANGYGDRWYRNGVDFLSATGTGTDGSMPRVIDLTITRYTGTLRGRLIRQDGSPAPLAVVRAHRVGEDDYLRTVTDVDGNYRFDHLPAGDYQIWAMGAGYPEQWAPGKVTRAEAGTYPVTAGGETVVDERFLTRSPMPTLNVGTLTGTVVELNTGAPVADACVTIYQAGWLRAATLCTDATGTYRVTVPTGWYHIFVRHDGYPDTWAPSAPTYSAGVSYHLSTGATVTANVAIGNMPYGGTIRGRIIDYTGAAPTERVEVRAQSVDGPWQASVVVQADGSYELSRLPVGRYRLSAEVARAVTETGVTYVRQWFPRQRNAADAELVPVASGDVVVRDEHLIPPAKLDVRLVDDVTGAPVTAACVSVSWEQQCNSADGVYHFSRIWYESTTAVVHAGPHHFEARAENILLTFGQTTTHTLRVRPAGAIIAPVARTADGSIPHTCAYAVPTAFSGRWLYEWEKAFCNNRSADGKPTDTITLGPLTAGSYQLFVVPSEPWGVQWLGAAGGTGDRRAAVTIPVRVRETRHAPTVRLDLAGAIAGKLRSRSTGAPIRGGLVRPFGLTPGLQMVCSNLPHYTTCAKEDGSYRLDRLGPYAWPVEFAADGHASEWSGGATDRFSAELIQVRSGQVTTLDAALRYDGKVMLDRGPNAPQYWSAAAYHAVTGDLVGTAVYHDSPFIGGLNTGPVLIQYDDYTPGVEPCWYYQTSTGKTRRLMTSPVVNVKAGDATGITLIPGQNCLLTTPQPSPVPPPPQLVDIRDGQPDTAAAPSDPAVAPEPAWAPDESPAAGWSPTSPTRWRWPLIRAAEELVRLIVAYHRRNPLGPDRVLPRDPDPRR